ncbi:HNH endonuclease [Planctopirus limnophila DSM 3776]|uniref:HNH endonuclease n=2 Tax=Planctopirus TaxID=1649480 RepID=D5SUI5_PLAL2|nr:MULTISPECIES: HNH endonuclease [Planctopirus]ADG67037.1 HNH endonuclease [Planctopirus limnophila DSM 3776]ODA28548.1 HNH endonuclease [Planctopirus hydrillae]
MIAGRTTGLHASVLALNRHYAAVQVISAKRAFCLLAKELAEVISVEEGSYQSLDFGQWLEISQIKASLGDYEEDADWVQSVSFAIQVPKIIRLLSYDRMPRNAVKFNRRNIFLRDENRCQYCGKKFSLHKLSLDHVMPKSRGGPTSWENIVCSCLDCNVRKGGRTPHEAGMKLMSTPSKPSRSPTMQQHLDSSKYRSWKAFIHGE